MTMPEYVVIEETQGKTIKSVLIYDSHVSIAFTDGTVTGLQAYGCCECDDDAGIGHYRPDLEDLRDLRVLTMEEYKAALREQLKARREADKALRLAEYQKLREEFEHPNDEDKND